MATYMRGARPARSFLESANQRKGGANCMSALKTLTKFNNENIINYKRAWTSYIYSEANLNFEPILITQRLDKL